MDDGSRDATARVVREVRDARVRLHVHERNRGQAEALNTAIRLARGDFVKFLAADDVLHVDAVERMVGVATANESVGFVFARRAVELRDDSEAAAAWRRRYANVHEGFGPLRPVNPGRELFERWVAAGFRDNWIGEPTSVLVERSRLTRIGLFNPHIRFALDLELWARALPFSGNVGFVDDELWTYRVHAQSLTTRTRGRRATLLDRAWLLHDLAVDDELGARYPELARLRAEAERRVLKNWLRSPARVPSAGAYLRARARGRPGFARL